MSFWGRASDGFTETAILVCCSGRTQDWNQLSTGSCCLNVTRAHPRLKERREIKFSHPVQPERVSREIRTLQADPGTHFHFSILKDSECCLHARHKHYVRSKILALAPICLLVVLLNSEAAKNQSAVSFAISEKEELGK